ncbi:tripartite motif-containing protein 46 isoform X2 [Prinia subflava]|uniref:tripartite motif-containing protein 46 isoform X2 n=1 Tax=Prinia subflava TaxID=208062 RepID=UPI002FE3B761
MAEGEDLQTFTSIMDALVRISTSMKNMERELVCPVCKEMYKQPLALPCTHNVCHVCASEVLLQNGHLYCDPTSEPTSPAATPSTRSPRLGRRAVPKPDRLDRLLKSGFGTYPGRKRGAVHPQTVSFPCPACQRDVDLGERGLGSLFRNLTLERVVERYRQTINISAAIMCQFCKPPQLEATKGCTECKSSFCNECFKLYHPWGTQKAQHEPTPPTLTFRPKGLMCPEHKEEVTHYCKTCQRLVCQLCRVRRTHTSHKITPVLSAYQALREKLTKSLAYILSSQDTVQTQIAELEETVKHTEVNGSQAKEEVSQLIQGLCAMLEEKRATLLQAIEECQQERLASLHGQIREHQAMLENSGMVGYAQEVLKETDHPCFVQAAKQLHNRILRATDSLQSFRPAANASFSHFQLDVSRELKLLTDLAFIRGCGRCRGVTEVTEASHTPAPEPPHSLFPSLHPSIPLPPCPRSAAILHPRPARWRWQPVALPPPSAAAPPALPPPLATFPSPSSPHFRPTPCSISIPFLAPFPFPLALFPFSSSPHFCPLSLCFHPLPRSISVPLSLHFCPIHHPIFCPLLIPFPLSLAPLQPHPCPISTLFSSCFHSPTFHFHPSLTPFPPHFSLHFLSVLAPFPPLSLFDFLSPLVLFPSPSLPHICPSPPHLYSHSSPIYVLVCTPFLSHSHPISISAHSISTPLLIPFLSPLAPFPSASSPHFCPALLISVPFYIPFPPCPCPIVAPFPFSFCLYFHSTLIPFLSSSSPHFHPSPCPISTSLLIQFPFSSLPHSHPFLTPFPPIILSSLLPTQPLFLPVPSTTLHPHLLLLLLLFHCLHSLSLSLSLLPPDLHSACLVPGAPQQQLLCLPDSRSPPVPTHGLRSQTPLDSAGRASVRPSGIPECPLPASGRLPARGLGDAA